MNDIMSLLMSGVFGYLNYELLVDLGEISHTESKENKSVKWILFSIIDYLIYIGISTIIELLASWSRRLWINNLTLPISILVIILITMKCSPSLFGYYKSKINQKRKSREIPNVGAITPRESAFKHESIYAYIFDFNGKLIHQGYVDSTASNPDLYNEFIFVPTDEKEINEKDVNQTIYDYYDNPDDEVENSAIYIDTDNKLKYYLIYYR